MLTVYRFVAWEVDSSGSRSIVDIIEIRPGRGSTFTPRQVMKGLRSWSTGAFVERLKSRDGGKTWRRVRVSSLIYRRRGAAPSGTPYAAAFDWELIKRRGAPAAFPSLSAEVAP